MPAAGEGFSGTTLHFGGTTLHFGAHWPPSTTSPPPSQTIVFVSSCKQSRFLFEAFRRLRPGIALQLLHGNTAGWWPLLAHALESCGAAGGLQELDVHAVGAMHPPQDTPPAFVIGGWAAALNQLCSLNLDLDRGGVLVLSATLAGCRTLQVIASCRLGSACRRVRLLPRSWLPRS